MGVKMRKMDLAHNWCSACSSKEAHNLKQQCSAAPLMRAKALLLPSYASPSRLLSVESAQFTLPSIYWM